MNELLDHLNKIYGEQTSNCSEICRKIVFALFAIIWALSFTDGNLIFTNYTIIVLLILVLYLIVDTLQYFLTALAYRKHFYGIKDGIIKGESIEKISEKEIEKREIINNRSFRFMVFKVALLPISFIGLIIILIDKI